MEQSLINQLEQLKANAPAVTDDFGTFDTRKRHSDVIREGEDTSVLEDVGNWLVDAWQNNITQVPEEESGISNTGAPESMQGDLAHVPDDSKVYAIKKALGRYFPEANKGGHSFDVYQDENSGKYVYTDPNTGKPTWIEPPGIEAGDWGDDGAVMSLETLGSSLGGGVGMYLGGPPGMYAGAATGSGIATGGYTYAELNDLLDKGYLDPAIYGTPEHPNELALSGESGKQGGISMAGSLVGDTVIHAGKQGFKKLARTKAFRARFPKYADRVLVQDSLNEAIRIQKGDYPLFSESEWPLQTTASILKALARRQRIALGEGVLSTGTSNITTTVESQAVGSTAKSTMQHQAADDNQLSYDQMESTQASALEKLGLSDLTEEQQKAAGILGLDTGKVSHLDRIATNMEQLESSALNWKNADLLREKHQQRTESIHKKYIEILKNSGLPNSTVRTLGALYLKQANNDIYNYLGKRRIYDSGEFNKDVTQTADDLKSLVDDFIRFTYSPDKANSSVKSALNTAESHLDARVNQAYLNILGDDFNPTTPIFDAGDIQGDVLAQILKLPKLFPELTGDTNFIKNLYRNIYDHKGNPRKLSWNALDTEIKTLRALKRAVWNAPTDRINKQALLDIEKGLLDWRYNTLKGTNGEEVLGRLNEADRLARNAHATFDSRIISSLVGEGTPIKEKKLFNLLTSDTIGNEDVYYIKNLMDSFVGNPASSAGPRPLSAIDKQDGQDLYNAVRDSFYNNYREKVLKETNLGEPMQLAGIDKRVVMSKKAEHDKWIRNHEAYLDKWLDPEDVANFHNMDALSNQLRAESEVLKDIKTTSGMKNSNNVFQATYGPGPDKYSSSEDVWMVMHNADGTPKKGAQKYIDKYQRMIFNDMNHAVLLTNLKKDTNITGDSYIDFQGIDNYLRKHEDTMQLWLGPDKLRQLNEVRDLVQLATTWRTRHKDDPNNQLSKMMNDGLRAYVGMFTRTGRMLTAVKRFKGRDEDKAIMQSLLDAEVAAKRMNHLDRSRIMTMMNAIGPKPAGRAIERDDVDDANISSEVSGTPAPTSPQYDWDSIKMKFKDGGLVHDYQLPTLNRPAHMDDMIQGYADGGYVTQDQMQGMMQQLQGIQPTLQAPPVMEPLIEEPKVSTAGIMSVEAQDAPTMTKKQKEKAKVKAVKKGNKRRTMAPPKTGILSGFQSWLKHSFCYLLLLCLTTKRFITLVLTVEETTAPRCSLLSQFYTNMLRNYLLGKSVF